jgi:Flp pilus assembly protein TadD
MPSCRQFVLPLALLLSGAALAAEPPIDHELQYRACVALVYRNPAEALESARAWEAKGGGLAARHCAALALFERGDYALAAERLEGLAGEVPAENVVKPPDLMGQAGNAWLLAGNAARARQALEAALREAPDDAALLIDMARAQAAEGDFAGALRSLDRALEASPEDTDALTFRASALRRLERLDEAFATVERALALNPDNPSAWLERGLVRHARGDDEGARLDLTTLRSRFEGTPAAEAAGAVLAMIEGLKR